jgi:hypothetical protein
LYYAWSRKSFDSKFIKLSKFHPSGESSGRTVGVIGPSVADLSVRLQHQHYSLCTSSSERTGLHLARLVRAHLEATRSQFLLASIMCFWSMCLFPPDPRHAHAQAPLTPAPSTQWPPARPQSTCWLCTQWPPRNRGCPRLATCVSSWPVWRTFVRMYTVAPQGSLFFFFVSSIPHKHVVAEPTHLRATSQRRRPQVTQGEAMLVDPSEHDRCQTDTLTITVDSLGWCVCGCSSLVDFCVRLDDS